MRGFGLLELLLAVALLAILLSLALPSYQQPLWQARRSEAIAALLQMQLSLAEYRLQHGDYRAAVAAGVLASQSPRSGEAHYRIELLVDAQRYRLTAMAVGAQRGDHCGDLAIDQAGQKGVRGAAPGESTPEELAICWRY